MHDLYNKDNPQGPELAYELGMTKTEAEELMEEQLMRTELGQSKAREHMKKIMGFTCWMAKTKPQCITCKAEADGIPVDKARRDHMVSRNAKDVQRANGWKKAIERT